MSLGGYEVEARAILLATVKNIFEWIVMKPSLYWKNKKCVLRSRLENPKEQRGHGAKSHTQATVRPKERKEEPCENVSKGNLLP